MSELAIEDVVARYGDGAYRLATGIVRNAATAEDVVHEAFSSTIRTIDAFGDDSAFGARLYGMVAQAAFRRVGEVHAQAESSLDELLPTFHEDGEHFVSIDDWSGRLDDPRIDVRAAVGSAVDDLSPQHRAVVFLHDVEGLPVAQVSDALGISVADVRTCLHRGRLVLRRRLAALMATIDI